jgi:hypothetical protein
MAADEEASQHAMHDVVVPDDHAAQLFVNGFVAIGKLGRTRFNGFGDTHKCEQCKLRG